MNHASFNSRLLWLNTLFVVAYFLFFPLLTNAQSVDWAISDGEWTDDYINCSRYTLNNEVIFAGSGNLDETYTSDAYIIKLDSTGKELWRLFPTSSRDCYPTDIVVDSHNDIIITGYYSRLQFDSITLTPAIHARIFVLKLNSDGEIKWIKDFGSSFDIKRCYANALTINDETDEIYITGRFNFNILFDTITITSLNNYDIFIASLNSNGEALWAKSYGGKSDDWAYDIEYNNKQLYVAGSFNDYQAKFDTLSPSIENASINGFLGCFNLNGSANWLTTGKTYDWSFSEMQRITIDHKGYLYTYGQLQGVMVFNLDTISPIGGEGGGMLIKYDLQGNIIWGKSLDNQILGGGYVEGSKERIKGYLTCDYDNNVFVATTYVDSIIINDTVIYSDSRDLIHVKYNDIGYPQWFKSIGGNRTEMATYIDTNPNKKILTAGYFKSDSIELDAITLPNNSGNSDADFLLIQMEDTAKNVCPSVKPIAFLSSDYICGDDSIEIVCDAEFGNTYSLFRNDTLVRTSYKNIFKINRAGTYYFIVNREFTCPDTTQSIQVLQYAKPDFTISTLTKDYLCKNDTVILKAPTDSSYHYFWYTSDTLISKVDSIAVTEHGLYSLTIADKYCSNSDTISILTKLPETNISSSIAALCPNSKASLSTPYDSTYTYNWFYNDTILEQNDHSIQIEHPGSYVVQVSNEYCYKLDSIDIISQNIPEVNIKEDSIVTSQLPVSVSPENASNDFYLWYYNDTYFVSYGLSLEATQYGTYKLFASNTCGGAVDSIRILSATMLQSNESDISQKVYPNPTKGQITVENKNSQERIIEIYNLNGECLMSKTLHENWNFDMINYPEGVYMIKVREGNRVTTHKILKE